MKLKSLIPGKARGIRDPRLCMKQAGGTLIWRENGIQHKWTDRPLKFRGHIQVRVDFYTKRGSHVEITDIRWKQLGSDTWWRIPDWPEGNAL